MKMPFGPACVLVAAALLFSFGPLLVVGVKLLAR